MSVFRRRDAKDEGLAEADLPPGTVRRLGDWAVVNAGGEVRAVSRRCRHQLADLSEGTLDRNGCLVCPWHGSRYDTTDGRMVEGPHGFLAYRGRTPGYTALVLAYGRYLRLRIGRVVRAGGRIRVR